MRELMTARRFQTVSIGDQAGQFEIMIYGERVGLLPPVMILHSIEFPVPPSAAFCEQMWANDLQVIFVRRAGYGHSSALPDVLLEDAPLKNGAAVISEAAMLRRLISELNLSDLKLLAIGSANPIAYRLVQITPEIDRTVFVNPIFNQTIWEVFSPIWFRVMLRQIISSKSGLNVAIRGMKLLIRRDPIAYYKHIYEKNLGDLEYVDNNRMDYLEAGRLALETSAKQLHYETHICLSHDPMLKDRFFDGIDAAVMIGEQTTDLWRQEMKRETDRLGLPLLYAPQGDIFCAYVSPETLLRAFQSDQPGFAFANQANNLKSG